MQVTVSLFGIIALIFVLHTVLQHLFSWFVKELWKANNFSLVFLMVVMIVIEALISLVIISQYLKKI